MLLVALSVVLTGCAVRDAPGLSSERADPAMPAARSVQPVQAEGVHPCTRLLTRAADSSNLGERLPELSLPCLISGPSITLSELRDRPVVINLWATWCGPCREEMPILQDAFEQYGGKVSFVGVDTRDDPRAAAALLTEVGVTYPQLVDVDGQLLAHLRVPGLPVTVVLDDDGTVVDRQVGPVTPDRLADMVKVGVRSSM